MPRFDFFRTIFWVKSVTLEEPVAAYSGQDPSVRAREAKRPLEPLDLHIAEDDAPSLAEPAIGDIIVLTQESLATHLVEVTGADVRPRPKKTIRRGTRDERFCFQRECKLIVFRDFDVAPTIDAAFGFEPNAEGGEVFDIRTLPAFARAKVPLWLVQRRIANALLPQRR